MLFDNFFSMLFAFSQNLLVPILYGCLVGVVIRVDLRSISELL